MVEVQVTDENHDDAVPIAGPVGDRMPCHGTTQRYDHTQREKVRSAVAALPLGFKGPPLG
jgi:hypothetical protein